MGVSKHMIYIIKNSIKTDEVLARRNTNKFWSQKETAHVTLMVHGEKASSFPYNSIKTHVHSNFMYVIWFYFSLQCPPQPCFVFFCPLLWFNLKLRSWHENFATILVGDSALNQTSPSLTFSLTFFGKEKLFGKASPPKRTPYL